MSFALDIFENSFQSETIELKKVFSIDHQPAAIYYFKSLLFVGTSHPQSLAYVLDAQLLTKLAVINLNDVAKSIDVIEKPMY